MTSTAPAGEGGGGSGTAATTTTATTATTTMTRTRTTSEAKESGSTEQAPNAAAPAVQQHQQHQQHPPPSPLSGCYLLVVLPEPHTAQHKDLILNRLAKGFLSWDKDSCHVDLEKELQALVAQAPEGEEARNGERLIQYATENLVTEVLIYPQSNTLLQCIRNLLASFTKHRHIIHAGYTFGGNGSWILQDGTFSLADFLDAFSEHEVQRVLRAYENSVTVDIHCAGVGDWTTSRLSKEICTRACRVRVNPDDVLTAGVLAITSFTNYIGQYLIAQTLDQLMEPSDVVGNIRFSHPTLYVFPGGQGDAALFGINGFNMLVDGGFARKACFWDFTRHLDRLDAVLVTRINNSNVGGMSSVLRKKKEMHVYPQIGHFFCNLVERRHSNSPDGDKDIDPLILNLIDIGQEMMVNLRHINLRSHPCYRDPEPINLYHKVGHGTLDMYVLSPSKDSREVREFMTKWNASDSKLFAGSHRKDSSGIIFPAQNLVSICALLVWQPANPEDTITRILFPGSTPQQKIFEGFERLKHLEFLKHPVCTAKSLSPSTSLMTLKDKAAILKPKLSSIERETKRLAETRREKRDISENKPVKKDSVIDDATAKISSGKPLAPPQLKTETKAKKVVENKKIESEAKESKKIEKELKESKKEAKKIDKSERSDSDTKKTDAVKVETEKTAPSKKPKMQKIEIKKRETKETTKTIVKSSKPECTTKPLIKPIDKKPKPSGEKKDIMKSSPTTPKKSMNGAATKTEISKTVAKSTIKMSSKISSVTPAKSAKDANNRMVVEQKNIELSSMAGSTGTNVATKAPSKLKTERKPISRRTKPVSPSKARLPISPAKSTRSTPTASVKSEKDAVIRKVKGGTTDSSAVSTPSGIEAESAIKLIDKNLTEKSEDISLDSIESKVLADLKEEREVVEEIEAVLQKAERIEEARKDERFEGDDEITAEATDKKEEDMTEEDVTAEMDDVPKKMSRKESQELTEEDEYLIVEKEEIYTEDSVQSGDTEQKHHLDEAESEKTRVKIDIEPQEDYDHEDEKEFAEEKKDEVPEKKLVASTTETELRKSMDLSPEHKELLKEEMKQIIASATEAVQKTDEKDDSGKKDSEDITKEPSSLSPDKLDSSPKADIDLKEAIPEKLEESQERISTLESGATTTAPTLPEDERIPLDEIKEDVDEKHVVEEVKEKDISVKQKEIIPETLPIVSKPEVKVLDVKPPVHHGIARDVVKTPDEVADLPVHEEVDPKLYRMEELEKDKEAKGSAPFQELKGPPVAVTVKEQKDKGVFSFFGKVADKFEKGIDKLTKKTRRDSEKDTEEKSSKSSSPKEPKAQDKVIFEDVDIEKVFPKIGKIEEKPESFEQVHPKVSDIKVAAIKETATFLQEEIKDSVAGNIEQLSIFADKAKDESLNVQLKEKVIEDIEEVEAFMEEASKKFRNVKDSLQDSLESLEDKVDETKSLGIASNDIVKDTMSGAAEKLVDIKSDLSSFLDSKEPGKVKFIIPSSEETEKDEDDSDGVVRDFKEAVRDVAEVLVGTAGIEIEKEDKPKDVEQIVKTVAKVLKEDDFLTEKTLFMDNDKVKEQTSKSPSEEAMMPKKVGVTEEYAPQEEVQELLEEEAKKNLPIHYEKTDGFEIREEPCSKVYKAKDFTVSSPVRDLKADKEDAMRICEDIMKDDIIKKPIIEVETDSRVDVMDLGIEEVCVKKIAKREVLDELAKEEEKMIVDPEISFEQKLSPGKAELVTVTPGSTPTSPKLAMELELPELSTEYRNIFNKDTNLESLIEEFIVVKKHKVTTHVLEYITIVKNVPKEKIINIIQEIMIKHKIPRDSVADSIQVLRTHDDISSEKRLEIEKYITNEYLNKNKKISLTVIEEIAMEKIIPKCVVIEIIEEIIINKRISRESVFDISEETYFMILRQIDDITGVSTGIEEIDDDKIIDGFVNISSTDAVEAFLQQERKKSHDEGKIVDDFEAVEQEYKVHGIPSTPVTVKSKEDKDKHLTQITEDVSVVIEADEKFVKETIEKSINEYVNECDFKEKSSSKIDTVHDQEFSEVSEIDTNEKYLDEAKEKTLDAKEPIKYNISSNIDSKIESEISLDKSEKPLSISEVDIFEESYADATGRSDVIQIIEKIDVQDSTEELMEEDNKSHEPGQESHEGIVKRMVVTASSEDGGHETEICPSGTIIFTKTPTPEDSLQDVDVKSTPEKDSLILEKESLRSTSSTPERDSIISDRADQDDDKITSEDSLEKIPDAKLVTDNVKTDVTNAKEFETVIDAKKSVETVDLVSSISETIRKSSIVSNIEVAKTPDSLHSGDASPAESVFSKSPTEKAFSHPSALFLSEVTETINKEIGKNNIPKPSDENTIYDIVTSSSENKIELNKLHKEMTDVTLGDRIESTGVEKETSTVKPITSDDALSEVKMATDIKVDDKAKSPSVESSEDIHLKTEATTDVKAHDKLTSSSIEKDVAPQITTASETLHHKTEETTASRADDKSKSPSIEKEAHAIEISLDKSVASEHVHQTAEVIFDVKAAAKSKSPSPIKEVEKKEITHEMLDTAEDVQTEAKQTSDMKMDDRSKSPSVEKDISKKEPTPEKSMASEDAHNKVDMTIDVTAVDKSKSPSPEKEVDKKPISPEKTDFVGDVQHEEKQTSDMKPDDRSKSPSIEKDVSKREPTPEKSMASAEAHHKVETTIDIKSADKSKSPSPEKEVDEKEITSEKSDAVEDVQHEEKLFPDLKAKDRSKSPSVEKDVSKKESTPEKSMTSEETHHKVEMTFDVTAVDKSKSPSPEKEVDKKEITPEKSDSVGDVQLEEKPISDMKTDDRSKSPSIENDVSKKEPTPEKSIASAEAPHKDETTIDVKSAGTSKSPSPEKEVDEKEMTSEKSDAVEEVKHEEKPTSDMKTHDSSKSPSIEKDVSKKEPTTEKSMASAEAHQKVETTIHVKSADKSKSPSPEKEIDEKEITLEKPDAVEDVQHEEKPIPGIKTDDRSKSPSVEKDDSKKEPTPEKSIASTEAHHKVETTIDVKSAGRSKSPSPEKEVDENEMTSEKSDAVEEVKHEEKPTPDMMPDDRSKSPSIEEDVSKKVLTTEQSTASAEAHHKVETTIDIKSADKSKSPSPEKDVDEKVPTSEKSDAGEDVRHEEKRPSDIKVEDRSKSPSVEIDDNKEEPAAEKSMASEDTHHKVDTTIEVKSADKSKSTSPQKEIDEKEIMLEKSDAVEDVEHEEKLTSDIKADDRSKSPSVEKDISKKEPTPEKLLSSVDEDHKVETTIDVKSADKSKSPSVEKEVYEKEITPEKSDAVEDVQHEEKPTSDTKTDDRSKSPSVEQDVSKREPTPENTMASAEAHDKVEMTIDIKSADKSKSPSPEKEVDEKEMTSEKSDAVEEVKHEEKPTPDMMPDDRSKSPSIEEDVSKKVLTTEQSMASEEIHHKVDTTIDLESADKSKSPSPEKVVVEKEITSTKSHAVEDVPHEEKTISDIKADDSSKSPSVETEVTEKEQTPEKAMACEETHDKIDMTIDVRSADKSKSQSPEKEFDEKDVTSEKSDGVENVQHDDKPIPGLMADYRSKSPSVEKDVSKKEPAPDKSIASEEVYHKVEKTIDFKAADKSKSPGPEKEVDEEEITSIKSHDVGDLQHEEKPISDIMANGRSKSPSVEKDVRVIEPTPEKLTGSEETHYKVDTTVDVKSADKSKSPSPEKEVDEKVTTSTKSHAVEDVQHEEKPISDIKADGRSKSPSVETDVRKKEPTPEKSMASEETHHKVDTTVDVKSADKSKSPSPEKEVDEKVITSTKTHAVEDVQHEEQPIPGLTADNRSKSPSVETDVSKKEPTPEKSIASEEVHHNVDTTIDVKDGDKSKSPVVEKDVSEKEITPEKSDAVEDVQHEEKPISDIKADDSSKSPSVEKDVNKKEPTPEKLLSSVDEDHKFETTIDVKSADKSKSPSVEKEVYEKEITPEKSDAVEDVHHVEKSISDIEADGRSKSPSVEKSVSKNETTPDKLMYSVDMDHRVDTTIGVKSADESKSPSPEKDVDEREITLDKSDTAEDVVHEEKPIPGIKADDRSKSPSVEKDISKKEPTPEKSITSEETHHKVDTTNNVKSADKSKSPSPEKEVDEKEITSTKSHAVEDVQHEDKPISDIKADGRSKSPSVETDVRKKEPTPEKSMASEETHHKVDTTVDVKSADKSKSPSPEKEVDEKEITSAKSHAVEGVQHEEQPIPGLKADDRSKSPSVETDVSKKEPTPEKSIASEEVHHKVETTIDVKDADKSKSPVLEKEVSEKEITPETSDAVEDVQHEEKSISDIKADDSSKSPSVERDVNKKEPTPEKLLSSVDEDHKVETTIDVKSADKSKSPSVEKEVYEKEITPEKSDAVEDVHHEEKPISDIEADGRSKSPSVEKSVSKKETTPDKLMSSVDDDHKVETTIDVKSADKSKSPSPEKEVDEKEITLEKSDAVEGVEHEEKPIPDIKADDRSKSSSVEKDVSLKEPTPEKLMTSVEAHYKVEMMIDVKAEDKSKSPSVEKEVDKMEIAPDKSMTSEVQQHIVEATTIVKADDRSKSLSVERDSDMKEISLDKSDSIKEPQFEEQTVHITADNTSKSPSVERDVGKVETGPEKSTSSEGAHGKDDTMIDIKAVDRSKSSSIEIEVGKIEISADKSAVSEDKHQKSEQFSDIKAGDGSKSPSVEKDVNKKELSAEKSLASEGDHHTLNTLTDVKVDDRSNSSSVEKKELSPEKSDTSEDIHQKTEEIGDIEADNSSKSPSVEKDVEKIEVSSEKSLSSEDVHQEDKMTGVKGGDKSKSPSVDKDVDKNETTPDKSMAPVDVHHKVDVTIDAKLDDKSRSSSVEKDVSQNEISSDISAASEVLHHKTDTTDVTDVVKSNLPSVEKELCKKLASPDKTDFIDMSQSLSHVDDAINEKDVFESKMKPSATGVSEIPSLDVDKSKSISPVSEKPRGDISTFQSIDDRKSSITSIESHSEDKGKDRSRSHSLFESGDKTPLVRSRAASLYEDKPVEKLGILDHSKDLLDETKDIFEEKDELRLSQETIDGLQIDVSRRDSTENYNVNPATRKAVEDYIFNEYVNKKRLINLLIINEISITYEIDQHIVMKIINDIIVNLKIKRETIIDFDEKDYEEATQKILEDEEKLTNYINDEYIAKKKKINSKTVDTIASAKSVSRYLVILVIENIISSKSLRRESVVDVDFCEGHDLRQKDKISKSDDKTSIVIDKECTLQEETVFDKHLKDVTETKSISPSPEPNLTCKSDRPDPHIDEEITISENKRIEVESLLMDDYITRGIKLTESILEQIIMKTSLPKYIIIEIIEEILIKKQLSRDAIAEKLIFNVDDEDTPLKLECEGKTPEVGERKPSGYSTPDTRNYDDILEKSTSYSDYESPFHKAFMGGMTEIRTTHITTLSGKSTPDFGHRNETSESSSETANTMKTTIMSMPDQFENVTGGDSQLLSSKSQSKMDEHIQGSIKSADESRSQSQSGDTVVVLKTTQITTYPDEGTEITEELITRESILEDAPVEKLVKQEESEMITKVIKQEIIKITGEPSITKQTMIFGEDNNQECIEILRTKTTKTINSGEELDPLSVFGSCESDNVQKILASFDTNVTTTRTSDSQESTKTSESEAKKLSLTSTTSASASNIDEKLISLDTQPSDISKTSISSSSGQSSKIDFSTSTPYVIHEEQKQTTFSGKDLMDHTVPEQLEQSAFPLIRDLITDDRSYSGKSSPDVSLPKDIAYCGSTGKSTPDVSMSPLMKDGSMIQSHLSGRSTPDRRSDNRSRTATPEGFRSGDVIRTIITTTRTMSDEGEIITTTQEVTEATNDKGETIVIAEKTKVKVDDRLTETIVSDSKPIDIQRASSSSSDLVDKEVDPTSPRSDLSSGHSRAATHVWGSSDERHTYSDEEQCSPPCSSSPYHPDSQTAFKQELFKTDDFSSAAMSSSFYGELPEESIQFHSSSISKTTAESLPESAEDEFSFKKFTVEKEYAGGYTDKGSKKYVDEADLDFEKALTGFEDEKSDQEGTQGSSVLGASSFTQELSKSDQSKSSEVDMKKDPLAGWGSPLGLPSPKAPRKFNLRSPIQPCSSADLSPDSLNFDVINDWGEPMRLPSPAPTANEVSNKGSPGTPKKEKKQAKKVLSENIKNKKRSESPSKNEKKIKDSKNKVHPVYVDLTYVSHHGNSFYTALEFFKKIRARYYVFSGTEPSREVYDALLEAKKTWEDKDLEVTMIPTYDTDTLGYWVADNEEALAAHHIDLSPSASRCTINLQDHETSCSAYRLEF